MFLKIQTLKDCKIEESILYGLTDLNRLVSLLELSNIDELESLLDDKNYSACYRYKNVNGKKSRRLIEAPNKKLKSTQKIFNKYLQQIITPPYVHAGRKKMSYIKNALEHINCNYMICADIKKFYPHTKKQYLTNFLLNDLKMSKEVAEVISELLTYQNHLPTGAPTSQLLTFWSYKDMFDDIYEYATQKNIKLTLYVDDMTFSSMKNLSYDIVSYIKKCVSRVGLQIHTGAKLAKYKNDEFKKVTGVAIDRKHRLKVINAKREEIKFLFSKYSESFENITKRDRKTAINKIRAMQLIESAIFQPSLDKLLKVRGI